MRLLAANGEATDYGTDETVDTFVRADGVAAGWRQRLTGGVQWRDAYETHPTQFDPWDIVDNQLDGAPTIRSSWGPGYGQGVDDTYPIDPETGEKYSPFLVSHRLMWADIGIDDEFEISLVWDVSTANHRFMQVSLGFGFDLDQPNAETGCLYAYDLSVFGGISYWHNVPMTPDVASCFDPTYYIPPNPSGAAGMTQPATGQRWWRARLTGGTMQAWFDGAAKHTAVTRPSFTLGRTTVGVHAIVLAVPPDDNYVGDAAVWTQYISDPPASAIVPQFRWRAL